MASHANTVVVQHNVQVLGAGDVAEERFYELLRDVLTNQSLHRQMSPCLQSLLLDHLDYLLVTSQNHRFFNL